MPRTLPWMKKDGNSTTVTRPKKAATTSTKPPKRKRVNKSGSEDSSEEPARISSKDKARSRVHSSSTPPEPPSERFMDEGMDRDDKYRMVEDEFLTVAQKWTVHLHAAEYKRQEKMVKARNAETIHSISRPVTERMPDQTRRRIEGVARSKAQRSAIEGLLGKNETTEDTDSDEDGLPYVGTTLHGLMDSPRKRAASLIKVESARTKTRAAAGFQKPVQTKTNSSQRMSSDSPLSKVKPQPPRATQSDLSTASEDEDDDLDAPILAPKLEHADRVRISTTTSFSSSRQAIASSSAAYTSGSLQRATIVQSRTAVASVEQASSRPSFTGFDPPRALSDLGERRTRKEQARLAKYKQETEEQKKKKLDIIPTFL